ncbi:MAG: histidine phosphatase family protein [Actinomycetes bacterium]
MSDLQCPARLLVLRHGAAAYADAGRLDDAAGGRLTDLGREQAAAVAAELAPQRVVHVYASPRGRARETAEVLASQLGVPITSDRDLREFEIGDLEGESGSAGWTAIGEVFRAWLAGDLDRRFPGGEDGNEVVLRMSRAVGAIADQHRGEAVAVVTHGGVMELVLPRVAANLRPDHAAQHAVGHCGVVELSVDADGWVVDSWCRPSAAAHVLP